MHSFYCDVQSLDVNILGVNTLHCHEDRNCLVTYRYIQVEYVSTSKQESELRRKLKATGLVINVEEIQQKSNHPSTVTFDHSIKGYNAP